MYSESNHIYTNRGVYSVYDLYVLKQNEAFDTIKFMTFNTDTYEYSFVNGADITVTEDDISIQEVVFYDLHSEKNIVVNLTNDTNIYQFDLVNMDKRAYLSTNKLKVNQYLQSTDKELLHLGPKPIETMLNYSVNMPNISLGDTLVRYTSKVYKSKEKVYNIIDNEGNNLPIFIGQAVNSFYNFVLIS